MNDEQWQRLAHADPSHEHLVDGLKQHVTLIKHKSNGQTYARLFYLDPSETAIHYEGSRHQTKQQACRIQDIDQIRRGFTTSVWRKCLKKRTVSLDKGHLVFSILYHNNRHSLDLLATTEEICLQWIHGLEYLLRRYRSRLRTHHEITDQWLWHLFCSADRDHSGHLSRREVRELLHSLNLQLSDHELDEYFNQANIRASNQDELRHLDNGEFLIFYKYVSYRPELLKIICRFNGSTPEETTATLSDYHAICHVPRTTPLERRSTASTISFSRPDTRPSPAAMNRKNYLNCDQLKTFLEKAQHMTALSTEDCTRLIARFEPSSEGQQYGQLGVDGLRLLLLHDEFCIMNPHFTHQVYHDMTQPLTDYFIATSHNTYIRDNQLYGDCTPETYIHALRAGCRAVEMDCYDGDFMEPMVYHGNTLTKAIAFRDIINAIEIEAFTASPYPLFLNIENHCSYEQQGVMARLLKRTFKDRLLTEPLFDTFDTLPSPEQLKYKVLVRSRPYPKGKTPADPKSDRSSDETEPNPKDYHPDFSGLIVYSQIVSFTNILHTMSIQQCFHSISFKESKADELIDAPSPVHLDMIRLAQQHLVRVYPGAARQDSSNIDPARYWSYGIQMVALNYQADDHAMSLQHGLFSDNGGCGYLLKPRCLRDNAGLFDPRARVYTHGKHVELHIISGQHLPKENDCDIVDPYVRVSTHGIECDSTKHSTPPVQNNGLNPLWNYRIYLEISCPELCVIAFKVRDADRYGRSSFLGQACFPLAGLQSGYRHIKLRAKKGGYIHGTLFVHFQIEDFVCSHSN